MTTIRRFEELKVWQLARELTRDVYAISGQGAFARDAEECKKKSINRMIGYLKSSK